MAGLMGLVCAIDDLKVIRCLNLVDDIDVGGLIN